jgi:predicted anti-sigma-YlaC factor YlaD
MTKLDCETICMAAMAIADGQYSELSSQQVEEHLAGCDNCRVEISQLLTLTNLLDNQKRRERTESVWPQVKGQLPEAQSTRQSWYPFLLLGVLLIGFRIVELVPERDFGFLFKLIPIPIAIAAFGFLKENPFKINYELRLEGE